MFYRRATSEVVSALTLVNVHAFEGIFRVRRVVCDQLVQTITNVRIDFIVKLGHLSNHIQRVLYRKVLQIRFTVSGSFAFLSPY